MNDNSSALYDLWHDFKREIKYVNRFSTKHAILDIIKKVVEENSIKLQKDTIMYRARVYNGDLKFIKSFDDLKNTSEESDESNETEIIKTIRELKKIEKIRDIEERKRTGFWGYDEKDSFIPTNAEAVKDGRANPAKITYLYVADSSVTALAEVRPFLNEYVSIAEIKVQEELCVADLTYNIFKNIDESYKFLVYLIMDEYSQPNNGEPFEYLTTQYISEYIKSLGFDGIKFNSSLYMRGQNYVIFKYDKCKAISSKLYQLEDICYDARRVGLSPLYIGEDIFHWKLEEYKKQQIEDFKKSFGLSDEKLQELLKILGGN